MEINAKESQLENVPKKHIHSQLFENPNNNFLVYKYFLSQINKKPFFRIFYTYRIWANLYENFIINQYILRNCRIVISSDYKTLD